jgi:hypothetical protein
VESRHGVLDLPVRQYWTGELVLRVFSKRQASARPLLGQMAASEGWHKVGEGFQPVLVIHRTLM